jgi:uncharacterized protein YcfJ
MKTMLLSCVAGATLVSAQAQWLFNPDSIAGAGLGAMIGGISGGNCHNGGFSGHDAAIGAGIGLLAGTVLGEARRQSAPDAGYAYAPAPSANVTFGYGYGNCGSSAYVYYSPNYYTAPGYYYQPAAQPAPQATYQPQRPNYAVGGTLLGAASGALIGSGIHHQTWEGAAIGAGAGLVLGGAAEYAARKHEQKVAKAETVTNNQVQQPAPAPTTQDARSEIASTPSPTSTYYWTTPPPQIPDAPRVPEPPRF